MVLEMKNLPKVQKLLNVKTSKEMFDATKKELKKKFDVVIMAAAASDYTPENFKIKNQKYKKFSKY